MSPTDSILVNVVLLLLFFFVNYSEDINLFVKLLVPLFWTSGDVYPGFKASGDPLTCVFCHMYVMGYRFTSGATPADILVAGMAVDNLYPFTTVDIKFVPQCGRQAL